MKTLNKKINNNEKVDYKEIIEELKEVFEKFVAGDYEEFVNEVLSSENIQ